MGPKRVPNHETGIAKNKKAPDNRGLNKKNYKMADPKGVEWSIHNLLITNGNLIVS